MINTLLGEKIEQTQRFLTDGTRIPVTRIHVPDNAVTYIKTKDKDGYWAVQLLLGKNKREVRIQDTLLKIGDKIAAKQVFKAGDIIDVIGVSKGKGFAGVVKRHHFKGGPRTHGQSDRERAPGSIGQTTTPGRVYKGKRMAGRMGHERVTLKNLRIVEVLDDLLLIKGLVPGSRHTLLMVKKVGEDKKFVPLYKEEEKEDKEDKKENAN